MMKRWLGASAAVLLPALFQAFTLDAIAGPKSAARGAPFQMRAEYSMMGPWGNRPDSVGAPAGQTPIGITPLPVDIFTTTDFYQDRQYWTDQRYYRCMDPWAMEGLYGAYPAFGAIMQGLQAKDAPWGKCDRGIPASEIVSPYPYQTAADHYQALLAEAKAQGGPTRYTVATLPDWSGLFARQFPLQKWLTRQGPDLEYPYWIEFGSAMNSELVKLLTPDYQQRLVQDFYHDSRGHGPLWPGSFCWPEGFMRWWTIGHDPVYILPRPEMIAFLSQGITSAVRTVVTGREFDTSGAVPELEKASPRWYGESIGFWDKDALIVWTSNIQGWTSHQTFEFSNQMQTIEIFTPEQRGDGLWLKHETIFYDPIALKHPVRQIMMWHRLQALNAGAPYTFNECQQTLFPINGMTQQVLPGKTIDYTVPDYFGRPWAKILENYFEKGMQPPEEEEVFGRFK